MYNQDNLILHRLQEEDLPEIMHSFTFPWSSFAATQAKWKRYYAEQKEGMRSVCVAKFQGAPVGYGSLLRLSEYPEFRTNGIQEIHDIWISTAHRRLGFGRRLIQYLEGIAHKEHSSQIGIGVGLYQDYGVAQKLYVSMGYIPDGKGITYKYQSVIPGDTYCVDDDLILWFKKDLS
ncbi:MAG: GNAT family N-acetyltransferase [Parachlamydia sp.]|nr:MAG: GNAT family N-acetyltransferase [Parachlamydia sp.]